LATLNSVAEKDLHQHKLERINAGLWQTPSIGRAILATSATTANKKCLE